MRIVGPIFTCRKKSGLLRSQLSRMTLIFCHRLRKLIRNIWSDLNPNQLAWPVFLEQTGISSSCKEVEGVSMNLVCHLDTKKLSKSMSICWNWRNYSLRRKHCLVKVPFLHVGRTKIRTLAVSKGNKAL